MDTTVTESMEQGVIDRSEKMKMEVVCKGRGFSRQ